MCIILLFICYSQLISLISSITFITLVTNITFNFELAPYKVKMNNIGACVEYPRCTVSHYKATLFIHYLFII